MTRQTVALSAIVLAGIVALGIWSGRASRDRELLREVYTPAFASVPPEASFAQMIAQLRQDAGSRAGSDFVQRFVPGQAVVVGIAIVVALVIAFDFAQPRRASNIDIVLALALSLAFIDIMHVARLRLTPEYWRLLDTIFIAIAFLNTALLVRAVWRVWRSRREGERQTSVGASPSWRPNLRGRPLWALALILVACDVSLALAREPDDAGYFMNLGAQRLRERGRLPFGDPLLTGTPGAAYGPVMYAAHIPFQMLIDPHSLNPDATARPPLGANSTYYLPPPLATKLCTITFHLAGVLALFIVGRRVSGTADVGWALVALYAGSAFVMGVGGQQEFIGGMTFASHIAPAAATLVAFACLPSPVLAGVLLAVGAGAGFYPAFMLPAWAGYFWRTRSSFSRFLAGFAVAAAVIAGTTFLMSRPADGRGRVGTILHDTFGHHTDPRGYGRSPFGFWGQRDGIRGWMTGPLVGESGLTSPAYVVFFGLVGATFFLARGASAAQLALLTAAIAIGASVIKVQSTGTYVAWAYPFLLIGIFADREGPPPSRPV